MYMACGSMHGYTLVINVNINKNVQNNDFQLCKLIKCIVGKDLVVIVFCKKKIKSDQIK